MNSLRREKILNLFGNSKNKKVLDIGCATGRLGKEIKDMGNDVYGVDISSQVIKEAKKLLKDAFVLDIQEEELPFKNNFFDVIILSEVIEHIVFPEIVLEKIKKVLKRDGTLIITTPNFLVFSNRVRMFFGKFEYSNDGILVPEHVHFFCYSSLKKFLNENGFNIEKEDNLIHPKIPEFIGNFFLNLFAFQIIIKVKLI